VDVDGVHVWFDKVFGLANKGVVEVDWGLHKITGGCPAPCTLLTSKERLEEG